MDSVSQFVSQKAESIGASVERRKSVRIKKLATPEEIAICVGERSFLRHGRPVLRNAAELAFHDGSSFGLS